jgi:hypothetical protein
LQKLLAKGASTDVRALASEMGGERTLATAEEQQPREDGVGQHLDYD